MTDDESAATHYFSIERTFDAPPGRVYRAFTEADRLERWFGPDGIQVPPREAKVDLRLGGLLHLTMTAVDDPGPTTSLDLVFEQIEVDRRLVLGDAWFNSFTREVIHTQLELSFASTADGGCHLELSQGPYSDLMAEAAAQGWSESLDKLEDELTRG